MSTVNQKENNGNAVTAHAVIKNFGDTLDLIIFEIESTFPPGTEITVEDLERRE